MTRKDYRLIAFAISNIGEWYVRKAAAEALLGVLASDNPNFEPEVFLAACDVVIRTQGLTNMTTEPLIPVMFRTWNDNPSDVFALFPTHPADNYGRYCSCYQHVGQHCSADFFHCIRQSQPARKKEYVTLLAELRRIGYQLRIIKRASQKMHDDRRREAGV